MSAALNPADIDIIVQRCINVAGQIRNAVESMDLEVRRRRTNNGRFSNQYELDVIADNIVHEAFADFAGYVVSEEREMDKTEVENNPLLLVVDPVDGSTNASHSLGYWCFSAALMFDGRVVAGVVVDQVSGRVYSATQHGRAKLLVPNISVRDLASEPINEDVGTLADNFSSSVICFNTHEGPSIPFRHLRHVGSSALAICDVASGGFDAYIDDEDVLLKPWDVLAAEYIALRSGCRVLRRDSSGLMAATGVMVLRSQSLETAFQQLFPHFFV